MTVLGGHLSATGALRICFKHMLPLYNLSEPFDVLGRGGCVNLCEMHPYS